MQRYRSNLVLVVCALGILGLSSGCRGQRFLEPPGPILQQQSQAIINDPFLQNDIAPFEATLRPPGYERPLPEPVRNRIYNDAVNGFNR